MITATVATRNLLVVDDVPAQLQTLRDIFSEEGFNVCACGTIDDALEQCHENSFAVAILDLRLGGRDGIELLAQIRQLQPGIRTIIHTAYGSFDSAKNAVNLGAFAYIEKGCDPAELINQVNRAVQEHLSEALTQSEQRYRDLLDDVIAIVWECEFPSLRFTFVSQRAEAILGYPVSSWLEEPDFWIDLLHPDDRERCIEFCAHHSSRGEDHEFDYRAIAADGRTVWLHEVVHVVLDDNGVPARLRGVMMDITERCIAEEGNRLRDQAFASSSNGIVIADATQPDLPIVYCNPAFERLTGFDQSEVKGRNCRFLQGTDRDQPGLTAVRKAVDEGHEVTVTLRNYRKNGTMFWSEVRISPVRDAEGRLTHFIGFQTDVTDRKKAEVALQESEERFRTLCSKAPVGIFMNDVHGSCTYMNEMCAEIVGISPDHAMGSGWYQAIHPEDRKRVVSEWEMSVQSGNDFSSEYRYRRRDGTTVWVMGDATVRTDHYGKVVGFIGTLVDINERKRAETELRESEHRFRAIFNSTFQFIGLMTTDGMLVEVNETTLAFGGVKTEDVLNKPFWEMPWWRGNEASVRQLRDAVKLAAGGEFVRYNVDVQGENGMETIDFSVKPVFDEKGNVRMLVPEGRIISETKRAQKALQDSEEKYRKLVENAPVCIHELNANGDILSMNQAGLVMLGASCESDVVGQSYVNAVSVPDRPLVKRLLELAFAGQSSNFEFESTRGQHFEACLVALPVENGAESRVMGIKQDVTERLRSKEKLRESETRFRAMFEQAAIGVAQIDTRSGNFLEINQRYCDIVGFSREEMLAIAFGTITHPADMQAYLDNMSGLVAGDIREFTMQKRYCRKDSSFVWVNLTVSPMWRPDEEPSTHIVIVEEITQRKMAQLKLKESEELFRGLVETAPFGVQRNDIDCRITFANAALGRIYGREPEEMIGCSVLDFAVDEQGQQKMRDYVIRQVMHPESTPAAFDARNRTYDGRLIDVHINWTYDRDPNGKIIGFIVIVTDITERKQSERALEFQADVLNRVSDAVLVTDGSGAVTYANEAAERLYPFAGTQSASRKLAKLHDKLLLAGDASDAIRTSLESAGQWQGENELLVNGESRFFDTKLKTFRAAGNEDRFLLSVMRDISTRKKAEEEVRQHAQMLAHMTRLSTMGELVAGIAHEVKQPLYAVTNFATAASVTLENVEHTRTIEEDLLDELKEWNSGVREAAQRASDIIQHSLAFARKGEQRREIIRVNQFVHDSIELIAFEARQYRTTVITEIDEGLPDVFAERIQCEQVMVNLLHNAFEVLAESDSSRRVVVRALQIDGFIEIQVEDNGPGIPVDEQGRLFEAFYTTKQSGMGMGLAISRTIVEDHGGRIWVTGNDHGGSTFHFTLPVEIRPETPSREDV